MVYGPKIISLEIFPSSHYFQYLKGQNFNLKLYTVRFCYFTVTRTIISNMSCLLSLNVNINITRPLVYLIYCDQVFRK